MEKLTISVAMKAASELGFKHRTAKPQDQEPDLQSKKK